MYAGFLKRVFDFTISLAALIILSPLLLLLTIAGAVAMRGNPFFVQQRPGRKGSDGNEKIFSLIKFRTMNNRKDSDGVLLPDSERLTGYGCFLRKTSIDELPELINILLGNMALVGPRPLLVSYIPLYSDEQRQRHDVRPGLTGWAQVNGRNSITWQDKFEKDVWYTKNITITLDIRIILLTVKNVLMHEGITSDTSVTMEEFRGNEVWLKEQESRV